MTSNIIIEVEFLAGTNIKEAITEAKEKAEKLDVSYISFNFNERTLSIGRNADIDRCVNQYEENKINHICES